MGRLAPGGSSLTLDHLARETPSLVPKQNTGRHAFLEGRILHSGQVPQNELRPFYLGMVCVRCL